MFWQKYLLVFVGGGLGSCCRLWLSTYLNVQTKVLPWGTLAVNTLACLVLGIVIALTEKHYLPEQFRWAIGIGFCGGFSTFSTFSAELLKMQQTDQFAGLMIYTFLSLVFCYVAIWLAYKVV